MSLPPDIVSEHQQIVDHQAERFNQLEALIMATKAQVEQAQAEQSAAFTDFADDVTAKLADLTAKLDAALAAETADAAALADMKALTDDVVTKTNAFTEAIKAADVAVDRPA